MNGIKFDWKIKKSGPSEKWSESAKRILNALQLSSPNISKKTMGIISKIDDIRLPEKGEQLRIRTQTQLNMISFVIAMANRGVIDELIVATYTLNKEAFAVLADLSKSGRIRNLKLMIASSYNFREPAWSDEIKEQCRKMKNVSLAFAWFHWKITLAKIGDDHFLIEGSMNYSMNNMAEQILFENDTGMWENDRKLLTETILENKTKAVEIVT